MKKYYDRVRFGASGDAPDRPLEDNNILAETYSTWAFMIGLQHAE
jgi:hypothetical protein